MMSLYGISILVCICLDALINNRSLKLRVECHELWYDFIKGPELYNHCERRQKG